MNKTLLVCAALFGGLIVSALKAQTDMDFAFSQLKDNGAVPFVNALYQDPDSAQRVLTRLTPLLQGGGAYYGYEVVSRRFLTKKVERIILALYFEKFPVYMRLDLYETPHGKVWQAAQVSKEATDVLPLEIISAAGK